MNPPNLNIQTVKPGDDTQVVKSQPIDKLVWETPKLEDVSEQVMAQPYIRFT